MECVIAFSVYSESGLVVDGTQKVLIHLVANDEGYYHAIIVGDKVRVFLYCY